MAVVVILSEAKDPNSSLEGSKLHRSFAQGNINVGLCYLSGSVRAANFQ